MMSVVGRRRRKLKNAVSSLVKHIDLWRISATAFLTEELKKALAEREELFGIDSETVQARIDCAIRAAADLANLRQRCLFLAGTIDLPARWIEDVSSGRR